MFGLTGAHRSGKSTTAEIVANKMGIEYLETKVGDVFKNLGIDPKAGLDFAQRLDVQNAILRSLEVQYDLRAGKEFIADRTPFDVLGYTLADIQRDTLDDAMRDRMSAHLTYGEKIAAKHLRAIMLLYPLPHQSDVDGKAQACPFYRYHVSVCIQASIETGVQARQMRLLAAASQSIELEDRVGDCIKLFASARAALNPGPKLWTPGS